MKKVTNRNLDNITGGTSSYMSGTIINAFVNIIKLLMEAGEGVGSSIRRISENKTCPLR